MSEKMAGVLVAAGLSSRMNAYKPLLELGGKPLIEWSIENLRNAGAEKIVVVTGHNAQALGPVLERLGVCSVFNARYRTHDMFESVRLGFAQVAGYAGAYFAPADIPAYRPYTLRALKQHWKDSGADIAYPVYDGENGHPILVGSACFSDIAAYAGGEGMRGALANHRGTRLSVPDPGILLDADKPADFARLKEYFLGRDIPDFTLCMALLKWFGTPRRKVEHGIVVMEYACSFARRLARAGRPIDVGLVRAGALLHDVAKHQPKHPAAGARWLREMGYEAVARVVEAHMDLPREAADALDERALVYLADKMVKGTRCIALDERFSEKKRKWQDDPQARAAIERRLHMAREIYAKIEGLS